MLKIALKLKYFSFLNKIFLKSKIYNQQYFIKSIQNTKYPMLQLKNYYNFKNNNAKTTNQALIC